MPFPSKDFWKSKRVLVTGHTGFKGAWLSLYLSEIGADVYGLALDARGTKSLYSELKIQDRLLGDSRIDIRDLTGVRAVMSAFQPEVIFHLAAQALVSVGYQTPLDTISTNIMGTANLLEATRETGLRTVFISVATDKVYSNQNFGRAFQEHDPLGGDDPYSASKGAADILSQMYGSAYLIGLEVPIGIARAGNVIGGGDWSDNRLFPDLVRAWSSNEPVKLRLPQATRPWQHVLEPLRGYLLLAEKLEGNPQLSGPINFGPDAHDSLPVEEVVNIASNFWPENPGWVKDSEEKFHESKHLSVDNSLAKKFLDAEPIWQSRTAIERTTRWYREHHFGGSAIRLCLDDIEAYEAAS